MKARYLERASYRQRRLRDVARMVPLFGTILILLPLFWSWEAPGTPSTFLRYIFTVWIALVIISAVIPRFLKIDPEEVRRDTH